MSRPQINIRFDPETIEAIDAASSDRSAYVRQAVAERIERDAGKSPFRLPFRAFVWQLLELAVFCEVVTPAELERETAKYVAR